MVSRHENAKGFMRNLIQAAIGCGYLALVLLVSVNGT
jgi:hypothetical protein